jgi:hypothetical protein
MLRHRKTSSLKYYSKYVFANDTVFCKSVVGFAVIPIMPVMTHGYSTL